MARVPGAQRQQRQRARYLLAGERAAGVQANLGARGAVLPTSQVIVVGGGLAGGSAANRALDCGGRTVPLDESSFCGGDSAKATSGINSAKADLMGYSTSISTGGASRAKN